MMMRRPVPTRFVILLALVATLGCGAGRGSSPSVLLIAFDGFRWDYTEKVSTPSFDAIARRGARVRELIPVFPTETFPNHYTVATGLLPVNHGIVSNSMYDPEFDATFTAGSNPENQRSRWWGGEPIWVTASKAGLRTSAFFWPGTDVVIDGHRPEPWHRFDPSVSYETRWRTAVDWFDRPAGERPRLVTLYFEILDNAGHFNGPDSEALRDAVREADAIVGDIVAGLEAAGALDDVNIVVTGDHGMMPTDPDRVILLDDWIDLDRVRVIHWSPVLSLSPDPDYANEALANLREIAVGIDVFAREDTPPAWRYRDHRRIADIIGVAQPGWTITSRAMHRRNGGRVNPGAHGYDPKHRDMRTTLYAAGPGVRPGARLDTLSNVHVYEFLCGLLEIRCAPNDGEAARTRALLR